MAVPTLFVGVVSHEGSRFAASQGPRGLAARLASVWPGAEVRVNTANLSSSIDVSAGMVQRALTEELRVEWRWDRYLGGSARYQAVLAARWAKRAWRAVRPPAPATIRRLLDIELSHRDLWGAGLDSGAPWILVLEDDGDASDVGDLASGIEGLMRADSAPAYVNLSRSFGNEALRVEHLLQPAGVWPGSVPRSLLVAQRPVTNTVCAILYSSSFLRALVGTWDALPMDPVIPVDWKLNVALMTMHRNGTFPVGGCLLVEPAPIIQGSMTDAASTGILGP